jgi:hypothetical protein
LWAQIPAWWSYQDALPDSVPSAAGVVVGDALRGAAVVLGRGFAVVVVTTALGFTARLTVVGGALVTTRRFTVVGGGGAVVVVVVAAAAAMSLGPRTTTWLLPGTAVATTGRVSSVSPVATDTGSFDWWSRATKRAGTSATVMAMFASSQTRRVVRKPFDRSPPSR